MFHSNDWYHTKKIRDILSLHESPTSNSRAHYLRTGLSRTDSSSTMLVVLPQVPVFLVVNEEFTKETWVVSRVHRLPSTILCDVALTNAQRSVKHRGNNSSICEIMWLAGRKINVTWFLLRCNRTRTTVRFGFQWLHTNLELWMRVDINIVKTLPSQTSFSAPFGSTNESSQPPSSDARLCCCHSFRDNRNWVATWMSICPRSLPPTVSSWANPYDSWKCVNHASSSEELRLNHYRQVKVQQQTK